MNKKSKIKSILNKLGQLNDKYSIKITMPVRALIPLSLIIIALTGRIGTIIALIIAIFLIFILMRPDN